MEGHSGRRLDHQRVDRGYSPAGQHHAVDARCGGGAQDHADIRRIGDRVQYEYCGRAAQLPQRAVQGAHPGSDHVGQHALVVAAVAGQYLHPVR